MDRHLDRCIVLAYLYEALQNAIGVRVFSMGLNFSRFAGWIGAQEPKFAGSAIISTGMISAGMAESAVPVPFDRVVDGPASDRVAAMPRKSLKERLRRPLMLVLPIVVAAFGAAYYLAEEPYVSTDDAFARAATGTV